MSDKWTGDILRDRPIDVEPRSYQSIMYNRILQREQEADAAIASAQRMHRFYYSLVRHFGIIYACLFGAGLLAGVCMMGVALGLIK